MDTTFRKETLNNKRSAKGTNTNSTEETNLVKVSGNNAISIQKKGWLKKQGHRRKNWKIRWFIIEGDYAYYFVDEIAKEWKGHIYLRNCIVEEDMKRGPKNFILKTIYGINFPIEAENEEEKKEWIEVFKKISESSSSNNSSTPVPHPRGGSFLYKGSAPPPSSPSFFNIGNSNTISPQKTSKEDQTSFLTESTIRDFETDTSFIPSVNSDKQQLARFLPSMEKIIEQIQVMNEKERKLEKLKETTTPLENEIGFEKEKEIETEKNKDPSVLISALPNEVERKKSKLLFFFPEMEVKHKDYIIVTELHVSIFKSSTSVKWRPVDGGISSISIIQKENSEARIVCYALTAEFLFNVWIQRTKTKVVSDTFIQIHIKLDNQIKWELFGISFTSSETAKQFLDSYRQCTHPNKALNNTLPPSMHAWNLTKSRSKSFESSLSLRKNYLTVRKSTEDYYGLSKEEVNSYNKIVQIFDEQSMNWLTVGTEYVREPELILDLSLAEIFDSLRVVLVIVKNCKLQLEEVPPLIDRQLASLSKIPVPIIDETILNAAVGVSRNLVLANLAQKIARQFSSLLSLTTQISTLLQFFGNFEHIKTSESSLDEIIIQLTILIQCYIKEITNLLNAIQTYTHIQQHKNEDSLKISNENNIHEKQENNINIWDDSQNFDPESQEPIKVATLNQLISKLTSHIHYDNMFLHTFISTYRSFTTPWELFQKLKERFFIPETIEKEKIRAIQLRVAVVLKYWLQNQISDFDKNLLSEVVNFVDNTLQKNGYEETAGGLRKIIERKLLDCEEETRLLFPNPTRLNIQSKQSLVDLFLSIDELTIVQQLTLIDFQSFRDIEISELLNQSWNKPHLRHRSPHVTELINRSTKLSYWVSTMVFFAEKVGLRSKIVRKFIKIATGLKSINNFNTMIGIVAGLNTSSVHRLKNTFSKISEKGLQELQEMHDILLHASSFKNYRELLKKATPPCLPYLGVHLTDLVFIEDGNPDYIDGKINFKKREIIYLAIWQLLKFRNDDYKFNRVEPMYTFLLELPYMEEEDLFQFSLKYEPRIPTIPSPTNP